MDAKTFLEDISDSLNVCLTKLDRSYSNMDKLVRNIENTLNKIDRLSSSLNLGEEVNGDDIYGWSLSELDSSVQGHVDAIKSDLNSLFDNIKDYSNFIDEMKDEKGL